MFVGFSGCISDVFYGDSVFVDAAPFESGVEPEKDDEADEESYETADEERSNFTFIGLFC